MEESNKQLNSMNEEDHLEFNVGPLCFCAPVHEVEAIISPPKIIHVPLSENVVAGCFDHQGRTATVLSMHNKFGLPFTLKEHESHIILATVDDELKGFWVDHAIDIIKIADYERKEEYADNDRKAYSNFLTSDEKIILQTSFPRLHKCENSNLNWIAGLSEKNVETINEDVVSEADKAGISDNEVDNNVTIEEVTGSNQQAEPMGSDSHNDERRDVDNKYNDENEGGESDPELSDSSIKSVMTTSEVASNTSNEKYSGLVSQHSDMPNTLSSHNGRANFTGNNAANNKTVEKFGETKSAFNKFGHSRENNTVSFSRATNDLYKNRRASVNAVSQDHIITRPVQAHTYDGVVSSERKKENKNNDAFILAALLLLLVALALGSIYLIDTSSRSEAGRSVTNYAEKTNAYRDKYVAVVPIKMEANTVEEDELDTVNFIEPEVNEVADSENQSLNQIAEEDEVMFVAGENARVFELHVNEQSDSEQYEITSFEPVTDKKKSVVGAEEFTHIVVKGDTLWHITRRYLDNPHRYPELAAASHINNPHKIYPGDVVKIIVSRSKSK